ncbi:MAG: hypothetical protein KDI68_07830 [Gammaproteobacteria bacterium]|nr:hypothetical protein [Gammaproteobacteria bacterium]
MEGTTGDPQRTATANVQDSRQQSSHGSSGRSRHSRSARKILKQKLIILGLSLALFIALLGWLFTAIRLSSVSDEYHDYRVSSRDELDQRKQNNVELDQLRSEREALVKGLIPGLHPLNFDETIDIRESYLRNIAFTLTGTRYSSNYEYRVVLHNDSLNIVQPKVAVFLFDARGIQVGVTRLNKRHATSKVESENLQPNETRAYTGSVELNLQFEPRYFLVRID